MHAIIKVALKPVSLAIACAAVAAHAQEGVKDFPNRPLRILCATSPGSGSDIMSRMVAQGLTERWGQSVVVENRAGAGGTIATDILAHATPNGYTFQMVTISAITAWMTQRKALFDVRDFTPVVELISQAYFVVVNPNLPVNSIRDLIAYAKAKPGALNYGSAGIGSTAHLGMELLKSMSGIEAVHVPYPGSSMGMLDLMAGRIQVQVNDVLAALPLIKQGKVKPLAVTSLKRVQVLPDLPTVSEAGVPGYELNNVYGILGPKGIPPAIVLVLNQEGSKVVNAPAIKNKLESNGTDVSAPNTPAEYRASLNKQVVQWSRFILKPNG